MSEDAKNTWEVDARCKSCNNFMRSQGYVWINEHTFYFYLKCGYCGKRLKGKKTSVKPYIVDWVGWEDMPVVSKDKKTKSCKKYMTARRKK